MNVSCYPFLSLILILLGDAPVYDPDALEVRSGVIGGLLSGLALRGSFAPLALSGVKL